MYVYVNIEIINIAGFSLYVETINYTFTKKWKLTDLSEIHIFLFTPRA